MKVNQGGQAVQKDAEESLQLARDAVLVLQALGQAPAVLVLRVRNGNRRVSAVNQSSPLLVRAADGWQSTPQAGRQAGRQASLGARSTLYTLSTALHISGRVTLPSPFTSRNCMHRSARVTFSILSRSAWVM